MGGIIMEICATRDKFHEHTFLSKAQPSALSL